MHKRLITPVQFAAAIETAQRLRATYTISQGDAVKQGCIHANIDETWAIPLLGFINDSPVVAEMWAKRQYELAVDRAAAIIESHP